VGLETVPSIRERFGGLVNTADRFILAIFVIEVLLKLAAEGSRPWRYFKDPWNVFDFAVTAICLLPFNARFAQVLRLGRAARSLRLVTALPRLQLIVGALLRSLPSFGWITLLLFMLLYAYSVMGVFIFGPKDPERFGSLGASMLTMFGTLTLEGWIDVMDTQMRNGSTVVAPLFFVTFILSGTMIFLNLLVGVIVNSMAEMPGADGGQRPQPPASPLPSLHAPGADAKHVELLVERVAQLQSTLDRMSRELQELRSGR
jgi:voltage-gated sodium channel